MSKWKLVPRTVTREIVEALNTACRSASTGREIWTAMLDAAPVPAADDCESVCDAYAAENQQFSEQLARLRAENERLKADAARYQHLKSLAVFNDERDMGPGGRWWIALWVDRRPVDNTLDAATDAAMSPTAPPAR